MRLTFLMLTALLSALACIPLNTPGAGGNNVYVANYFFTPVVDTATAGNNSQVEVTFRWADSTTGIGHTVVWDSGPQPLPDDAPLTFSGTYTVTLFPGRYGYHCDRHADQGMAGVIVVVPFGTQTSSRTLPDPHQSPDQAPVPALVTQPSPGAVRESPRRSDPRSPPVTS